MAVDFNDILTGGGKTLKPETIGETVGGKIVASETRQTTDFTTGDPQFWPDGSPKIQIVFTIKQDGEEEEGCIYVKNWGQQRKALAQAVKNTGLDANHALAAGNYLYVTYKGEEPNQKNPRLNATKIYEYKVEPRSNVGNVLETAPAPAKEGAAYDPWATNNAPAGETAAAPAAEGSKPGADAKALLRIGLDTATVAKISGLDEATIEAIRATLP